MSFIELLLIAVGLSMDAFAIAICKGLSMKNGIVPKQTVLIALFFGGFQALMPLIGYLLGSQFESYIKAYDHWVAFVLLAFIGGKMLYECLFKKEEEDTSDNFSIKELFLLAVATSIDALAVGISFAVLSDVNVWLSVSLIGAITFLLSATGVVLGNKFGSRYKKRAEITGGVILILMGVKILLEHLEVISF